MSQILDYDELARAYEETLLTTLRGHGAAAPFLDIWVPDEDPLRGLLSMVEAAQASGQEELSVMILRSSLGPDAEQAIKADIGSIGHVVVEEEGQHFLVHVSLMQEWQDMSSVPASMRFGVITAGQEISHEGELDSSDGCYTVESDGMTLSLLIDPNDNLVKAAKHSGANDLVRRAVFDVFCGCIIDLPLQEAADHGCLKTINFLTDKKAQRAVPGIVTHFNAGDIFDLPLELIRELNSNYRRDFKIVDTQNFFHPAPREDWTALSDEAKIQLLEPLISKFSEIRDLDESVLEILSIDNIVRVTISCGEAVEVDSKPKLMMDLEAFLRAETEVQLELYFEAMRDQNKIRRL